MNYLLTAHAGEAHPFIRHFDLRRSRQGSVTIWTRNGVRLLVTGEGEARVRRAMETLMEQIESPRDHRWLNFGLAGSAVFERGSMMRIDRLVAPGGRPEITLTTTGNPLPDVSVCLTVDGPPGSYPLHGVVDQEAYHIGEILQRAGAISHLAVLKLVGDGPGDAIDRSSIPGFRQLLEARDSEIIRLSAMISGMSPTTGS